MARDKLEEILREQFGMSPDDIVDAFEALAPAPAPQPSLLSAADTALLDQAGFIEDSAAHAAVSIRTATALAELIHTALSAGEVAHLLSVGDSRVRQRRLERTLWAIHDHGRWLFPRMQFRLDGPETGQIRGLAQVLAALPADLPPLSIAGFLSTPQADLVALIAAPYPALPTLRPLEIPSRTTDYLAVQVPPLIWLDNGGAPAAVVAAASHSESWGMDVSVGGANSDDQPANVPPPIIHRPFIENIPTTLGAAHTFWTLNLASPTLGSVQGVNEFTPAPGTGNISL